MHISELNLFLNILFAVITFYFFLINSIYLFVLSLSLFALNRRRRFRFTFDLDQAFKFRLLPPVSIVLPAYNEEKNIVESVNSLLFVHYPSYEIIVVNDGSKDNTLEVLKESFRLMKTDYIFKKSIETERIKGIYVSKEHQNILVVDKLNGGKADALNAGINVSNFPYFCAIDADSILDVNALAKLIVPFIDDPMHMTAVGGVVKPANGADIEKGRMLQERLPRNLLVLFQTIEYARSFFMGRMGLSSINSLPIISGAFGLFRKEDVLNIQGYKRGSLGEDMLLVVKLHKLKRQQGEKYRIGFVHDTVCWTEIPSSLRVFRKQRLRWQMGLLESIVENREMFGNPRYGSIGFFSLPFYFFSEVVPPFLELIGYGIIAAGLLIDAFELHSLFSFFLVTWIYGIIHSFVGLALEQFFVETTFKISNFFIKVMAAVFENLFYRQINIIFKIAGVFKFLTKKREWGAMERSGFK